MADPYLDPAIGILRNKVGATTQPELDAAEADLSSSRLIQLLDDPPEAMGNLDELQAIHGWLFQDVYEWAGRNRTVDMRKKVEGAESFLPASMIDRAAVFAAEDLRDDHMLQGMGRDQFVDRLAHHYDQFNYLHPFREGNGRAQRVFWSRIARDAGWELDWQAVRGPVNDEASRAASEERDFTQLHDMLASITTPATTVSSRGHDWRAAEMRRLGMAPPDTGP